MAILLLGNLPLRAEQQDSITVSLITCWPGREVFELDGHSALRVQIPAKKIDDVFNYGVFDFNTPNFIYRFVKGETDYILGIYQFPFFMKEYEEANRKVLEQELNLSAEEKKKLIRLLYTESLPQNREYRYNYALDNCATRITMRLTQAIGDKIQFPDTVAYGTFRNEMRHFHRDYPWYQFGIDLCLGSGIDIPITADHEMFVPVIMAKRYADASLPDGRPLVKKSNILFQGSSNASLPPTPLYLTPLFVFWVTFAIITLLAFLMIRKNRVYPLIYTIWFFPIAILGCLSTFLVFFSSHYATSPNLLILWLNPLQFIMALGVWWKSWRVATRIIAWIDIVLVGILILAWPFQIQVANPAFFPMMLATLILCITYAILDARKSYIYSKHEKNNRHTAGKSGRTKRGGSSKRSGKTAARSRNSR